jgi:DUF4097 and DUF4098 domain-containing protein YvlB
MKRIAAVLLALGLMFWTAGATAETTIHRTLKLAPGGKLILETSLGSVTVQGSNEPDARVTISARGDLNDLLTFRFEEEPGLARIVAKSRHRITWSRGEVRFEVQVPSRTQTDVRTSGGPIKETGLDGAAKLDTSGGSIDVRDLAGELDAHTSGGAIRVANVRGRSRLETSGGGISGSDLAGPVHAETSGGPVELARVTGDIQAHSSGGGIRIEEAGGRVQAETSGGGIEASFVRGNSRGGTLETSGGGVTVSLDPAANIEIEASGNSVRTDLPLKMSGELSRNHIRGTLGSGGQTLRVRTSGGGVHIQPI